jgi:hypothetical protein
LLITTADQLGLACRDDGEVVRFDIGLLAPPLLYKSFLVDLAPDFSALLADVVGTILFSIAPLMVVARRHLFGAAQVLTVKVQVECHWC